jgi:acyl carrier protein
MIQKLKQIIVEVSPDIEFGRDLIDQIDSLDMVLLVEQMEQDFSISIEPEDIDEKNFKTFEDLAELLKRYVDEI